VSLRWHCNGRHFSVCVCVCVAVKSTCRACARAFLFSSIHISVSAVRHEAYRLRVSHYRRSVRDSWKTATTVVVIINEHWMNEWANEWMNELSRWVTRLCRWCVIAWQLTNSTFSLSAYVWHLAVRAVWIVKFWVRVSPRISSKICVCSSIICNLRSTVNTRPQCIPPILIRVLPTSIAKYRAMGGVWISCNDKWQSCYIQINHTFNIS